MSALRLLCSLPLIAATLVASATARDAVAATEPVASSDNSLIEVKDAGHTLPALELADDGSQQAWSVSLDELDFGQSAAAAGFATSGSFANIQLREPEAPPIIAAPLPPAFVSGLIGLAGVYAYRRRQRIH